MITYIDKGSIFDSNCDALVNPVNCVGVMGAGLAKQFKERYPINFSAYKLICNDGLNIGDVFSIQDGDKTIINFPTKIHFNDPSIYKYISEGMNRFVESIPTFGCTSFAFPALGCGLGKLDWTLVNDIIVKHLKQTDHTVYTYELYPPK